MSAREIFVAIVVVCLLNGVFSPAVVLVFYGAPLWYPGFLPLNSSLALYLSSLLLSTATLILSGVPAALWERLSGSGRSTPASMAIWLAAALLLSIPAGRQLLALS